MWYCIARLLMMCIQWEWGKQSTNVVIDGIHLQFLLFIF